MGRYTVKQVTALTGIPPARLRAWERRYGVVGPSRTPSGYRLYTDDEVTRLARMARLVSDGTPASLAAREVSTSPHRERPADVATGWRMGELAPAPSDVVAAARTLDGALLDSVVADAFARGSFEMVVEQWLMPILRELGAAWEAGEVDVAGEHFVSATVLRRLSAWFEAAPVRPAAPVALVGLPAGSWHQLGTLTFAACLRRQGVDVRYLGPDVPRASWVSTARTVAPAACVMGVPTDRDGAVALGTAAALTGSHLVFLGGPGVAAMAQLPPGVVRLDDGVAASARRVAAAVQG